MSFDPLIGSDSQNRVDPRVDATGDSSQPGTASSHHGGEAAAGVGAAGVAAGAYEEGKHHDSNTTGTGLEDTTQTTSGPHSSNLENKLDPRVNSDEQSGVAVDDKNPTTTSISQPRGDDATTAQTLHQDQMGTSTGLVGSSNNTDATGTGSTQVDNSIPDRSTKMSDAPDTTTGKSISPSFHPSRASPVPILHEIRILCADLMD